MAVIQQWPHWGRTTLGTAIDLYASPDFVWDSQQRPLLLFGGVHGDEPEGVALARDTLTWLEQEHRSETSPVQQSLLPWILIPCLNPDGYRRQERVNANGVDLNRNYPASNWQPQSEKNRYWPGPSPGSELETQIIVRLIERERPRLIIHCHSWKPCVVYTGQPASADAERLAQASGYPAQDTIGYPTPGSLSHFGWHDHGLPVICIEAEEKTDPTLAWPRFKDGLQAIFRDTSLRIA